MKVLYYSGFDLISDKSFVEQARLVVEPVKDVVGLHYSKTFKLSKDSKAVCVLLTLGFLDTE